MPSTLVRKRPRPWHTTLAAAVLLGLGLPVARPAPHNGVITGRVRDEAGAPIPSAQVRIDLTAYAAVANSSGAYRLSGIPAGTYSLVAKFVGYKSHMVTDVVVRENDSTTIDFTLSSQPVGLEEITVESAVNPLVPRDEVHSKQRVSGDLPVDRVSEVLALQPGATVPRDNTLQIRGGRDDEKVTYIDGVPVRGRVAVGTNGFEDGSVTTGALSAEFGSANGVITFPRRPIADPGNEDYHLITENRFLEARTSPLSTFSIDVDAASYSNVRRFLGYGQLPPVDAVRIEELVNYFEYSYPEPRGAHPFSISLEEGACPWHEGHRLVLIGLQGKHLDPEELPPSNLVFLLDVSGSMSDPDKLPLVKQSFRLLVQQLREQDRVSIVVYAGAAGLVLPPTSGDQKGRILAALDQLEAGGSTAGGAGIQLAYQVAQEQFLERGNNRVILATDGDFNVGVSSDAELVHLIEERRDHGIFLTVLGFGTGNLKDGRMEQLADKGNGQYAYVDNIREGRRVFVNQMAGTLFTIAKDVKLQVEFNPARVASYRLIGYENRVLATEDFADDRKDAGDLGAGHSVTALYEIEPVAEEMAAAEGGELRYQAVSLTERARSADEWLTVQLRYKQPDGRRSRLLEETLRSRGRPGVLSDNFRFASAVAEFGLLLRQSEHRGSASAQRVLTRARTAVGDDTDGFRREFLDLVQRYQTLNGVRD